MRIGIISSSGGSVLREVVEILKDNNIELFVITDRPCGTEKICADYDIPLERICEKNNEVFSKKAKECFMKNGNVDFILLFFVRIVTKPLIGYKPIFNLHPSILPAYKGFNAINKFIADKGKFFGTTLHVVNEKIDDGEIIAQAIQPVAQNFSEDVLNKLSFVDKVYLFLLLVDLLEQGFLKVNIEKVFLSENLPYSYCYNPMITNEKYVKFVEELRIRENIDVLCRKK